MSEVEESQQLNLENITKENSESNPASEQNTPNSRSQSSRSRASKTPTSRPQSSRSTKSSAAPAESNSSEAAPAGSADANSETNTDSGRKSSNEIGDTSSTNLDTTVRSINADTLVNDASRNLDEEDTVKISSDVENNRPLIKMAFSRKRSTFGKYIQHTQYDASDSYRFCTSFVDPKFVTKRVEREFGAQNVKPRVTVSVQTPRYRKVNKMTQNETMLTKDVEVDEVSVSHFLSDASQTMETILNRNDTFRLFEDDFSNLATDDIFGTKSNNRLKKGDQTYTHMDNKNKKVSSLDWQPKTKGVVAFAVVDPNSFEERMLSYGKARSSYIVVWNFNDPIYPQIVLEAPTDVLCFKFNPYNPNIVAAGLINGQVAMWDLSEAKEGEKQLRWSKASLIESSHRGQINDLQWILHKHMKNEILVDNEQEQCYQFVTVGADGKFLIWDRRIDFLKSNVKAGIRKSEKLKGAWIPYHSMNLCHLDGNTEVTAQCIYIFQENPYLFSGTSQDGEFFFGDWTPKSLLKSEDDYELEEESTNKKEKNILTHLYSDMNMSHFSVANSIDRHPTFQDYFLSAGDWGVRIWKKGTSASRPILISPYSDISSFVTCAKWSPTRPSVLYIGKSDGKLEVWDFLDKSYEASMIFTINTQASITSISFRIGSGNSKFSVTICAVGTSVGTLHVVEMPRNLIKPQNSEEQLMLEYLEREEACVRYYEQRWDYHSIRLDELKTEKMNREKSNTEVRKKEDASDEPDYTAMTEKFLSILKKYEENQNSLLEADEEF